MVGSFNENTISSVTFWLSNILRHLPNEKLKILCEEIADRCGLEVRQKSDGKGLKFVFAYAYRMFAAASEAAANMRESALSLPLAHRVSDDQVSQRYEFVSVGWARYKHHGQRSDGSDILSFVTCNSDDENAFEIFRQCKLPKAG